MSASIKISDMVSCLSNVLKETHEGLDLSPSHSHDLVLLCADNVPVYLNQVVMANLSPMMRELFLDQGPYHEERTCFLPDYKSNIVRKLVEIIYTGKAMFKTRKRMKRIKKLMKSFGISICLDCGDGSVSYHAEDEDIDATECNESERKSKSDRGGVKYDMNRESVEGNEVEMELFESPAAEPVVANEPKAPRGQIRSKSRCPIPICPKEYKAAFCVRRHMKDAHGMSQTEVNQYAIVTTNKNCQFCQKPVAKIKRHERICKARVPILPASQRGGNENSVFGNI